MTRLYRTRCVLFLWSLVLGLSGVHAGHAAGNPLAGGADRFAGTFKNDEMALTIKAEGGAYKGTISFDGKEYPFTARKAGAGLAGKFQSDGESFDFTAAFEGKSLKLETGGTTHTLQRQATAAGKPNPLAGKQPENPLAGKPSGKGDKDLVVRPREQPWKVLRHPIGISIRYPAAWSAKRLADAGYQLLPPNAGTDAGQPNEAYFIMGAQAPGIQRADDPQLVAILEAQVQRLAPFLERAGNIEEVKTGSEAGARIAWEGNNPNGKAVSSRMYVVLLKGSAVCLFELGYKERIAARDKEVRSIFATLGVSQEQRDPQAAGTWAWRETRSGGAANAMQKTTSVGENRASLVLSPEGAARRSETCQAIAGAQFKNSAGESTGSLFLDTGPKTTVKNGRWYAGDGRLVLLWDDDTGEEYDYKVQGAVLVLTSDKGSVETWGRATSD